MDQGRVLHIIYSMKQGGAERLLLDAVAHQETAGSQDAHYPARIVCWHHAGSLAPQLDRLGVPHVCLDRSLRPIWTGPFFLADLMRLVRDIARIARDTGAPLVHGHLIDSALVAVLVARRAGLKSVATIYSNHVIPMSIREGSLKNRIWTFIARWTLGQADRVVSLSSEMTRTLVGKYNAPADRTVERPVVVEPVVFSKPRAEARAVLGVAEGAFCLAFVGRLVENKNQADLLRMTALLLDRGVPAHLLLAGDGPDRPALAQLAQDLAITDHVSILGLHDDLTEVLAAADLFVTASKSEGVSLALLEAMSADLPIVSAPNEGNSELLKDGIGSLAADNTPEALADCVDHLWRDPDARAAQAARARAFYEAGYTGARAIGVDNAIYAELAHKGATA